ncbi:MAG: 3-deoxy-8-phosphooctulonate synthase [Candidatus Riflebacteria bacterium HGW-Riflebacteria-2]|jgi:2-dehydro-3-deoxyphosphooctonate aldolase (KDO 8-P synthase)|nr:MAG: 3-deoxy-8-phosphooctulonate synthase [Candidatus Riflebacteria bacterium HGW-Riflebacteria-2]
MAFSVKRFAQGAPFFLIAGPCVIESEDICLYIAQNVKAIAEELKIPAIFKASFDKANRTAGKSFRGPGLAKGLEILASVKAKTGMPALTDVHEPQQCAEVAKVCEILQIPAFLCRQTDLTEAAAATGRIVNIKKGQFLSPWATKHLADKVRSVEGSGEVLLTERGASFGYGSLVVDMRAFPIMREYCDGVVYDATHSLQLPSSGAAKTGGQREFIATLARAAIATGDVDGLFVEVHPEPEKSPSDADNILPLDDLKGLLCELAAIKNALLEARKAS